MIELKFTQLVRRVVFKLRCPLIMRAKLLCYIHIYFHTTIVIFPENHLNETLHKVSLYE
jgi:hypothetical protein